MGAINQGIFAGTPLRHILETAGYAEDSMELKFTGADRGEVRSGGNVPNARSLPINVALHPDTLVAWNLNTSLYRESTASQCGSLSLVGMVWPRSNGWLGSQY